jgi:hypothetical protein
MTLSPEMRQQLLARAGELRTEVTSLTAERDAALLENSQSREDAKLIAEVQALEAQAEEARRQRDLAVNDTDAALAIMQRTLEEQERTATLANAGEAPPALGEVDSKEVDASAAESSAAEAEAAVDKTDNAPTEAVAVPREEAAVAEETRTTTKQRNGGSR